MVSRKGIISGINVTPLVDVMLVLLVIFIVTAKIIGGRSPPDSPHAAHGEEVQVVFSVIVLLHGAVLVDGAPPLNDDALAQKASGVCHIAGDPDLRAVIQADGDIPHRRINPRARRAQGRGH